MKDKGITPEMIYNSLPEIGDDVKNYFTIKQMDEKKEYDAELNKLSLEIIDYLKKNEDKIVKKEDLPEIQIPDVSKTSAISDIEIPEVPEIEIPDISIDIKEEEVKKTGYNIAEAKVNNHIWMKILSVSGIDYKPKIKSSDTQYSGFYFWVGDQAYIVTNVNPFDNKEIIDIYIYSDNSTVLENMYNIVQSRILGYKMKQPVEFTISADNLNDFLTPDSLEPSTNIPYKLIDDAVEDLWKLNSREELDELVSLSKKYGCGCYIR